MAKKDNGDAVPGTTIRVKQKWRDAQGRKFFIESNAGVYMADNKGLFDIHLFAYGDYTLEIVAPAQSHLPRAG